MARRKRGEEGAPDAPSPPAENALRTPNLCVVGIGASAGGVEAFKQLLQALRKDTGLAFVILLHLPNEHVSMLADVLGRVSAIPVTEVYDRVPIEPNRAYVLPAGADVDVSGGELRLTPRQARPGQHHSVDHFFSSLAEHYREKSIGVVLSGNAADGTAGIQEIKAAGGLTFAQDDTAAYTSMPRSAIASGAIDFVLPPDEIARELGRIASHPFVARKNEAADDELLPDIGPVLAILRTTAGVDFTQYKPSTLYRRIARRILLHKLDGIAQYVRMLKHDAAEANALYQDVLINVTSFFRNPEAFEVLKSDVFPALTKDRSRHDPVRIWTLGCSTGEEAYSIAIAFAEFAETLGHAMPLQVFATDLNASCIDRARLGSYPRSAMQGVSPERLRRFFIEVDGHYRVSKQIRDACVFAQHNAICDPPFTRMDLVSCRNMLIYLGAELQQQVIPVMHYALRGNGFLWLGTSETIGSYRDLFDISNSQYKIYTKKGTAERPKLDMVTVQGQARARTAAVSPRSEASLPLDPQKDLDRLLAARYAPPNVVVTDALEIIQYRGDTSPYLSPMPGKASLNLLKMVREELVLGVRAAAQAAIRDEAPARQEDLRFHVDGVQRRVDVEVIPLASGVQRASLFLVVFEEGPRAARQPAAPAPLSSEETSEELPRLQQELAATREYLQSVIEQQEAANEELQSANEEVQSTNEELQSINEELETSKEEVQSTNEELATVNDELHARNSELAQTNNDMVNLLASVQMPIIMLGPDLRIRRFTPMAEKLVNLIPTDVGRRMSDIKWSFEVPGIDELVEEVVDTMSVREREVQDSRGCWHLLRIRPYRTMENKIDGAVIVLFDVDTLKRSQDALRQQTELLNQAHEPIVMWELDGDIIYWNKAAEETYGFTAEQAVGRRLHELLMISPPLESFAQELREHGRWTGEVVHTRRDAQKMIVESRMVVVGDSRGRKLVVEANRPITERKESERVLRRLADDLVVADRHKDEFLAMLGHELRNPLAPLRNVVALLRSESADPAAKSRALMMMDRQISSMTRLIDDLLDVSRITLSQIDLRPERMDVAEAVARVVEQNAVYFESRGQRLQVTVPPHPVEIDADPVRVEQIVGNLLHNASKYTQSGGEISVSVEESAGEAGAAQVSAGEVLIRVTDNGIGIAPDKLSAVFDMFMRATRSTDQHYGGLGLGLTLVSRLVELHRGRVEARSAGLGHGSEFIVWLPASTASRAAEETPADDKTPGPPPAPRRVLVVDDNIDNSESMGMLLRYEGHEVEVAASGARALEVVREFRPDVMLIDISMPEMDGYTLAKRLREDGIKSGTMLVAMSGYGHEEAKNKARESGFDEYLVKPVGIEHVNRVLAQRSQQES